MNLLFLKAAWLTIKKSCIAVRDFCVKYWQIVVGAVLLAAGYILGKGKDEKVEIADADAERNAASKQRDDAIRLTRDHLEKKEKILEEYEDRLEEISESRGRIIEDLSNNDEKLDNILKDKYNLKKGD